MDKGKNLNITEAFVGTVLLDNRDRIYLIKEDDKNKISKGRWNLPGGSIDEGEGLIEAIARETKEETGYTADIVSLLGCYLNKKEHSWVYIVFEARVVNGKVRSVDEGIKTGKWFTKSEFLHMDSSEIVHPDMHLVYNIAIEGRGLPTDSVKFIDYNLQ